jgi:peptidyl-prolyl cis-trans isomerase A (cyclophilin A)
MVSVVAGLLLSGSLAAQTVDLKDPSTLTEEAPPTYRARFETGKGPFVIEVTREWAPLAADRFYNLVKHKFYDGVRVFRVLDGFMAQFGLNGDPEIQRPWQRAGLADEPVVQSNLRGYVSFAKEDMPNTRYTMVFINFADNAFLDKDGFAPFGRVVTGMEVVDKLYSGYGRRNQPNQPRILREGNAYLTAEYPMLDVIRRATIVTNTPARRTGAKPAAPSSPPASPPARP